MTTKIKISEYTPCDIIMIPERLVTHYRRINDYRKSGVTIIKEESIKNCQWEAYMNYCIELKKENKMLQEIVLYNKDILETPRDINKKLCRNGGIRENIAGFGVIATINKQNIITNKHRLQDIYNSCFSHQSEAHQILCAIRILKIIYKYKTNLSAGKMFM